MRGNFHISEDGVIRRCVARSIESCGARGMDGDTALHFNDKESAKTYLESYYEGKHGVFKSLETENIKLIANDLDSFNMTELNNFANESRENHEILSSVIKYRIKDTAYKYDRLLNCDPSNKDASNPVDEVLFKEMKRDFSDFDDTTLSFVETYMQSKFYKEKYVNKNLKSVGTSVARESTSLDQEVIDAYETVSASDLSVLVENDFCKNDVLSKIKMHGLRDSKLRRRTATKSNLEVYKSNALVHNDSIWRKKLKDDYAENNLNKVLISSDSNYQKIGTDWQQVNFDGVIFDPASKKMDGLLKIKTNVDYSSWSELPLEYRGEGLYCLDVTGLDYVDVLVQNKKKESKIFKVYKDEELVPGVKISDYLAERVGPWFIDIKKQRKKG